MKRLLILQFVTEFIGKVCIYSFEFFELKDVGEPYISLIICNDRGLEIGSVNYNEMPKLKKIWYDAQNFCDGRLKEVEIIKNYDLYN